MACDLTDKARSELVNKQICCYKTHEKTGKQLLDMDALAFLSIIFPDFKVVKSEFSLYPGEDFIYIGEMKWIPKIQKRVENHVIVATTGEFDMTDRNQVLNLCFLHHGKTPPKYVVDLIDTKTGWTDEQFWYNMKHIWLTGTIPDRELVKNDLFIKIITNFKEPLTLSETYLKAMDMLGDDALKYIESSLINFIIKARNPKANSEKVKKGTLLTQQDFYYKYNQNVSQAVSSLLESPIDNSELKYLDFLLDLCWPRRRDD